MKGHIRKRGTRSWAIVLDIGRDENGKRQQRWHSVQGTKRDAERELARLLNEFNTGSYVEPSRLTVAAYLKQWLKDAEHRVAAKTLERYRGIVEGHVTPAIGHLTLAKLKPLHIQKLYSDALATWPKGRAGRPIRSDRAASPSRSSQGAGSGHQMAVAGAQSGRCRSAAAPSTPTDDGARREANGRASQVTQNDAPLCAGRARGVDRNAARRIAGFEVARRRPRQGATHGQSISGANQERPRVQNAKDRSKPQTHRPAASHGAIAESAQSRTGQAEARIRSGLSR